MTAKMRKVASAWVLLLTTACGHVGVYDLDISDTRYWVHLSSSWIEETTFYPKQANAWLLRFQASGDFDMARCTLMKSNLPEIVVSWGDDHEIFQGIWRVKRPGIIGTEFTKTAEVARWGEKPLSRLHRASAKISASRLRFRGMTFQAVDFPFDDEYTDQVLDDLRVRSAGRVPHLGDTRSERSDEAEPEL